VIGTDPEAVIGAIRDARKRAGLTQEQAAALRGHATSTISRWETGGLPQTWEELSRYAYALNETIVLTFGHHETKEALPPQWARGLADEILSAVQAASAEPALERIVDRLVARLGLPLSPDGVDAHEADAGPPDSGRTKPLPRG